MFLYQTKLLAFVPFWNLWVKRWTGNDEDYLKKGLVDVTMLNKSILTELIFESLPQIIIQVVNGFFMKTFTLVGYFSIAMSSFFIINGIYSFVFYLYCKKVPFDKIPNGIDIPEELRAEKTSVEMTIHKAYNVVPDNAADARAELGMKAISVDGYNAVSTASATVITSSTTLSSNPCSSSIKGLTDSIIVIIFVI